MGKQAEIPESMSSQIACTVKTLHITCMQTAVHIFV